MSLAPTISVNPNGVSARRAAPATQDSSATSTKWPLLTKDVYTRIAGGSVAGVDVPLARLGHARNRVWQALQAIDAAMAACNPQAGGKGDVKVHTPVYNKLRALRAGVEKASKEFPLEVR